MKSSFYDPAALPPFLDGLVGAEAQKDAVPSTTTNLFDPSTFEPFTFESDTLLASPLGLGEPSQLDSSPEMEMRSASTSPMFGCVSELAPSSEGSSYLIVHNGLFAVAPSSSSAHPSVPSITMPPPASPTMSSFTSPVMSTSENRPRRRKLPSVALDSPIEPRAYSAPSRTSRKAVPQIVATELSKKRSSSTSTSGTSTPDPKKPRRATVASYDDADDDLLNRDDAELTVEELVKKRRMSNTLSARVSRQRKAAYVKELEESNAALLQRNQELEQLVMSLRGGGGGS